MIYSEIQASFRITPWISLSFESNWIKQQVVYSNCTKKFKFSQILFELMPYISVTLNGLYRIICISFMDNISTTISSNLQQATNSFSPHFKHFIKRKSWVINIIIPSLLTHPLVQQHLATHCVCTATSSSARTSLEEDAEPHDTSPPYPSASSASSKCLSWCTQAPQW